MSVTGQGNRGRKKLWGEIMRVLEGRGRSREVGEETWLLTFFCVFLGKKVRNSGISLFLYWHLVIVIIISINLIG